MSHTRKKTHTAIYHIFLFFFVSDITHHTSHITHHTSHITYHTSHTLYRFPYSIRERSISAADVAILVVVVAACGTHERESARSTRVAGEVGTVVKSSITCHTDSVFVLITFLHALFMREFKSGLMRLLRLLHCQHRRAGGSSSSSPVVGSRGSSHCSFGCL
jgi:hypothetical protein